MDFVASIGTLAVAAALVSLTAVSVAGQAPAAAGKAKAWTPPKTADGQPDLQGRWSNQTTTPLERPAALAGKAVLTDEEVAKAATAARDRFENPPERRSGPPLAADVADERKVGTYNRVWSDLSIPTNQTSMIVDPPDGMVPLTEEAKKMAAIPGARSGWTWRYNNKIDKADSFTDRNLWERCITRGMPGAMIPAFYNHTYQIFQTPGYVAILVEMIHDARIIPLDGRPHLQQGVQQYLGDSRGRWEGNTLVVETTNFNGKATDRTKFVFGASEKSRLVERFTRVDADTIDYEFTFEDPKTFTRPWTAKIPMNRIEDPIYEYACHEGNYSVVNQLAQGLAQKAEEVAKKGSTSR